MTADGPLPGAASVENAHDGTVHDLLDQESLTKRLPRGGKETARVDDLGSNCRLHYASTSLTKRVARL
jgi:hypothetical protein